MAQPPQPQPPSSGGSKAPVIALIVVAVGCGGLVLLAVLGILAGMLLPALARAREEARRIRCRNNLNQLAMGASVYLVEHGEGRYYPFPLGRGTRPDDFNGAEWLASLYWTAVVPDPAVLICPSSPDSNNDGASLGADGAQPGLFDEQTVSYAAMHDRSLTDATGTPVALRDDYPPNMPMACDDTQLSVNHGEPRNGGMSVLFFDSHVEFKTNTEIDLERGVGETGGLLERLRN